MSTDVPLACDLSVFTPEARERHGQVAVQIQELRQSIREFDDGYAFQLPGEAYTLAAEYIDGERRCCPFFRLMLEVEPGAGAIWLHLRGSSQIKAFLQQEFALS